jgi:O-antigen/teichoic acid export membrane protein
MGTKAGLAGDILSGLLWTAWGKGAKTLLQFIVLLILARLMTPVEFGVIGAAMIVIGLSEIFAKVGIGPALVQRPDLNDDHLTTAFSISVLLSIVTGAAIWIAAPLIASFFDHASLTLVLQVLSLIFLIRGVSVTAESLARRNLRFKFLANCETASFAAGYLIVGVGLGLAGHGVWALVAANLVVAAVRTAALLKIYPPIGIAIKWKELKDLLYFGGGFSIARLANYAALNADYLVVGRWLGIAALGFYGRAYQLMSVSASAFGQVLDEVLFPSMAKMQADRTRLGTAYLRGVSLVALVMLPLSVAGFILAPEIVSVILGDQWREVTLPFQILIAGMLMRTSYKISDSLARATGAVYRRAWRQVVYALLVFFGALVGQWWGIAGVAAGVLIAVTVNFLLMAHISLKLVDETWRRFFGAHSAALAAGVLTLAASYPTAAALRALELHALPVLALTGLTTALVVGVATFLSPGSFLGRDGEWMFFFLKDHVRKQLTGKRKIGTAAVLGADPR